MLKRIRRTLSILLALAMVLGSIPVAALADDEQPAQTEAAPPAAPAEEPREESKGEPTGEPTEAPTGERTEKPTGEPTEEPTEAPTGELTEEPTGEPTEAPTDEPTEAPTDEPADAPTDAPTDESTDAPTDDPTGEPTETPTEAPAVEPTEEETNKPTVEPSAGLESSPAPEATPEIPKVEDEPIETPSAESEEEGASDGEILEENSEFMLLSADELIQLFSQYFEGEAENAAKLKQILLEKTGVGEVADSNHELLYFGSADFDGDGTGEAFAFVKTPKEGTTYANEIKLVFVTENGIETIAKEDDHLEGTFRILDLGDQCLFVADQYSGTSYHQLLWTVEDGRLVSLTRDLIPNDWYYEGGNVFTNTVDDFDLYDDNTGHTWKPYYYFYENKKMKEYGGIYISTEEFSEFEGADEILNDAEVWLKNNEDERAELQSIIYRSNGVIHLNYRIYTNYGYMNKYITVSYDNASIEFMEQGEGYYKSSISENAVFPNEFKHPSKAPCSHEHTRKVEDADKRKYSYAPLDAQYHSVTVTKQMVLICDDCNQVVEELGTETEVLPKELHALNQNVCTKCGYENKCAHDGETHTETTIQDSYKPFKDGTGHLHTIVTQENTVCDLCGAVIASEVLSTEEIPEEHDPKKACSLCGYKPECKHERIKLSKFTQNGIIHNDGNSQSHVVQMWEVTVQTCLDCGNEIKRTSKMIGETRQAHTLTMREDEYYGIVKTCEACGYQRCLTRYETVVELFSALRDDTSLGLNMLILDVINQNKGMLALENLTTLPNVASEPFQALKKAIQRASGTYYSSFWKEVIYSSLLYTAPKTTTGKSAISMYDEKEELVLDAASDFMKKMEDYLEVANEDRAGGVLQFLGELGSLNSSIEESSESMNKACREWTKILESVELNIERMNQICQNVSQDSDMYKACAELRAELMTEVNDLFLKITADYEKDLALELALETGLSLIENYAQDFPLLSVLSTADIYLKEVPIYQDFMIMHGSKEELLDLYVIRVQLEEELRNATMKNSSVAPLLMDLYEEIIERQYDAAETFLSKNAEYNGSAYEYYLKTIKQEREDMQVYFQTFRRTNHPYTR